MVMSTMLAVISVNPVPTTERCRVPISIVPVAVLAESAAASVTVLGGSLRPSTTPENVPASV